MNTVIYGAQGIALSVYKAYIVANPTDEILGFVVTSKEGNPVSLAGLPVIELRTFSAECTDKNGVQVIVATPKTVMDEIVKLLNNEGFTNIILAEREYLNNIYTKAFKAGNDIKSLYALSEGVKIPKLNIYMACSKYDKALKRKYDIPNYISPIHVGAAGPDNMKALIFDNTGDNISKENPNYCELTALYWQWKNVLNKASDTDYYGLCQYRRMLDLSESDLTRLSANDIDVVLPFPLMYEPNIEAHRKRYIKDGDWNALMRAIEHQHPDQIPKIKEILNQQSLYNYNVIIAKRGVLVDYCQWLFGILAEVEELSVPKCSERADRYIGYMGETLETIYFMMNADRLNIAFAGCSLLL